MSLFNELKRRNVIRVAMAYVVASWLIIQVVETILPAFGYSDVAIRFIVIILAIAFIPVLVLSWVFEITPEGLKREADVVREHSITRFTGRKLDRIIIALLALSLSYFAFDKFVLDPVEDVQIAEVAHREGRSEAITESYGNKSIAVLPFVNMSGDPEQEYFSDGISEELLNLLAKIPELRVTSRSSAFFFKGKSIKLPEVAKELKVAHILEGSVRKSGNQIRISVQLVEAHSDIPLWSDTYDRTLDDVFVIQDDIASKVVEQLKITLLGNMPTVNKTDIKAYTLFLQARHLLDRNTVESYKQSAKLFQQLLEIDPSYLAAWNGLSVCYLNQGEIGVLRRDESIRLGRKAVNRALALDPDQAITYARLSVIEHQYDRNLVAAAQHMMHALALDPGNIEVLNRATWLAWSLGYLNDAITVGRYVVDRDPINPRKYYSLGLSYLWARRLDDAISSFHTALTLSPGFQYAHYRIGIALLLKGEPQLALKEVQLEQNRQKRLEGEAIMYFELGQADLSDAALHELIEIYEHRSAYNIAYVSAFRGESDQAFYWLDKALSYNDNGFIQISHQPEFMNIHNDPRWIPFLKKINMLPEQLAIIDFEVNLPQ